MFLYILSLYMLLRNVKTNKWIRRVYPVSETFSEINSRVTARLYKNFPDTLHSIRFRDGFATKSDGSCADTRIRTGWRTEWQRVLRMTAGACSNLVNRFIAAFWDVTMRSAGDTAAATSPECFDRAAWHRESKRMKGGRGRDRRWGRGGMREKWRDEFLVGDSTKFYRAFKAAPPISTRVGDGARNKCAFTGNCSHYYFPGYQ